MLCKSSSSKEFQISGRQREPSGTEVNPWRCRDVSFFHDAIALVALDPIIAGTFYYTRCVSTCGRCSKNQELTKNSSAPIRRVTIINACRFPSRNFLSTCTVDASKGNQYSVPVLCSIVINYVWHRGRPGFDTIFRYVKVESKDQTMCSSDV